MLTHSQFKELLEDTPIIPAIKNQEGLEQVLSSESRLVFVLFGDLLSLPGLTEKLLAAGKFPMIHADMINGLAANPVVADYLVDKFHRCCGMISTKNTLVRRAIELDMRVIQRIFILDSLSRANYMQQLKKIKPDALEVIPGVIPKVIHSLTGAVGNIPLIAGGLLETKEEVMTMLAAGCVAISTTSEKLWES